MSASVIPIAPQSRVDEAWDEYAALRRLELDRPELLLDRAHVNATIRAHERYRALFLMRERGR